MTFVIAFVTALLDDMLLLEGLGFPLLLPRLIVI